MVEGYEIVDIIWQEEGSMVFQASGPEGFDAAVWRFSPSPDLLEHLQRDNCFSEGLELLKGLRSRYLRQVVDGGLSPVDGLPWVATPYLSGATLRERMDAADLNKASLAAPLQQAIEGLKNDLGNQAALVSWRPRDIIWQQDETGKGFESFVFDPVSWFDSFAKHQAPSLETVDRRAANFFGQLKIQPEEPEKDQTPPPEKEQPATAPGKLILGASSAPAKPVAAPAQGKAAGSALAPAASKPAAATQSAVPQAQASPAVKSPPPQLKSASSGSHLVVFVLIGCAGLLLAGGIYYLMRDDSPASDASAANTAAASESANVAAEGEDKRVPTPPPPASDWERQKAETDPLREQVRQNIGREITLTGKIRAFEQSNSGKTSYLLFSEANPKVGAAFRMPKDAGAELLDWLQSFIGHEVRITGKARRERGSNRLVLFFTRRSAIERVSKN